MCCYLLISSALLFSVVSDASTVSQIRERGYLLCGVGIDDFGFATRNRQGQWQGFDVDFCRAVATAVLQDAQAVQFVPLDSQSRFQALTKGEIDLLIRTSTWTFSRDVGLKLSFAGITLHDQQVFLAHKKLQFNNIEQAQGHSVCVTKGTTSLANLTDYIRTNALKLSLVAVETQAGRWQAFLQQRCDLMTSERSDLLGGLQGLVDDVSRYHILADTVSREPLGPVVRDNDPQWQDLVRWVINATLIAEFYQLNSDNIEQLPVTEQPPEVQRLMTGEGLPYTDMGVDARWAYRVIRDVGNYRQIFSRNLGATSRLDMSRGQNALWSDGGIMYAPPLR